MDTAELNGLDTQTKTGTTDVRKTPSGEGLLPVPGLVIIAHPDSARIGEEAPLTALPAGSTARLSRLEPSFLPPGTEISPRPLGASFLSRRPLLISSKPDGGIVLSRGDSPIEVRIEGEILAESRRLEADEIERGVVLVLAGRITLLLLLISTVSPPSGSNFGLVGQSRAMVRLRKEIHAASLLRVPVLLRGETGTGKELVARAVHDARPHSGPYLTVNLGALVPSLAAAELFGAKRGAYTGADRQREGFFRQADGGTLFLDEIGEAPTEVQVMLLRVLETGRVQPVGGVEERPVDVRVVTATDADLETAIGKGSFRPALLHRLAGYEIQVPPLRVRRDDIARLLVHFFTEETRALGDELFDPASRTPWLSAPLMARLVSHDWPGNVRELRNVARRLAISRHVEDDTDPGPLLDQLLRPVDVGPLDIGPPVARSEAITPVPRGSSAGRRLGAHVKPEELIKALELSDWRPGPAAQALGLSRQALHRLIDNHPDLRTAAEIAVEELQQALERHGTAAVAARALRVSLQGLKRRITALGLDSD